MIYWTTNLGPWAVSREWAIFPRHARALWHRDPEHARDIQMSHWNPWMPSLVQPSERMLDVAQMPPYRLVIRAQPCILYYTYLGNVQAGVPPTLSHYNHNAGGPLGSHVTQRHIPTMDPFRYYVLIGATAVNQDDGLDGNRRGPTRRGHSFRYRQSHRRRGPCWTTGQQALESFKYGRSRRDGLVGVD